MSVKGVIASNQHRNGENVDDSSKFHTEIDVFCLFPGFETFTEYIKQGVMNPSLSIATVEKMTGKMEMR